MTESCPHQRKIFDSPLANHFSPVMQCSLNILKGRHIQGVAECSAQKAAVSSASYSEHGAVELK